MMTIIENAKVKLEKEEDIKAATDFFSSPTTEKGGGPLTLRQKLRERQENQYRQRTKTVDIRKKVEPFTLKKNHEFAQMKDSSILLINSSSFEIDSQAIKDRSVSMVLREKDDSFESETSCNREKEFSQHSFMGLTSEKDILVKPLLPLPEIKENLEQKVEEEKKNSDSGNTNNIDKEKGKKPSFLRKTMAASKNEKNQKKKEKIVVNKRFVYWDEQGNLDIFTVKY